MRKIPLMTKLPAHDHNISSPSEGLWTGIGETVTKISVISNGKRNKLKRDKLLIPLYIHTYTKKKKRKKKKM